MESILQVKLMRMFYITPEASHLENISGRARPTGVGAAAEKAGGWANGRSPDHRALKSHAKD